MTENKEQAGAPEPANTDDLSPEEAAFFESGGEQEVPAEPEKTAEAGADEGAGDQAEADAGDSAEGAPDRDKKGQYVPHGALHAEREEHKKTRSELNEIREKWARLEERFNGFSQQQGQQEQAEDKPPDPNEDIFAAFNYERQKREAIEKQISEQQQQAQQQQQAEQQDRQIWGAWESDARAYVEENPDFKNAAEWLSNTRDKQLQAFSGVDPRFSDPRMRNWQIEQELKGIVASAKSNGKSSAEVVYEIARSYGYEPKQDGGEQGGNASDGVSDRLKRLEDAQNGSRTVGQASGKGGADDITPENIANMSEQEFNSWIAKPENERKFMQLMGG